MFSAFPILCFALPGKGNQQAILFLHSKREENCMENRQEENSFCSSHQNWKPAYSSPPKQAVWPSTSIIVSTQLPWQDAKPYFLRVKQRYFLCYHIFSVFEAFWEGLCHRFGWGLPIFIVLKHQASFWRGGRVLDQSGSLSRAGWPRMEQPYHQVCFAEPQIPTTLAFSVPLPRLIRGL